MLTFRRHVRANAETGAEQHMLWICESGTGEERLVGSFVSDVVYDQIASALIFPYRTREILWKLLEPASR